MPNVHSKPEPSWGEPAPPPSSVDNGTSAWGKPPGGCGSWPDNGPEGYGRGNGPPGSAPCKPGWFLTAILKCRILYTQFLPYQSIKTQLVSKICMLFCIGMMRELYPPPPQYCMPKLLHTCLRPCQVVI